eukprot:2165454-Amphidinium_carterae.1
MKLRSIHRWPELLLRVECFRSSIAILRVVALVCTNAAGFSAVLGVASAVCARLARRRNASRNPQQCQHHCRAHECIAGCWQVQQETSNGGARHGLGAKARRNACLLQMEAQAGARAGRLWIACGRRRVDSQAQARMRSRKASKKLPEGGRGCAH